VAVVTAAGTTFPADLVIGADGARSTVRAAVDPERPDGRYAGVLLWRAMVDEQAMPGGVRLPPAREPAREVYAGPCRLVTYPVPGPAGETAVGRRWLNLVWYDPQQSELLRAAGLLDGETIRGSLAPGTLPGDVRQRLADFAAASWPSPWREALAVALASGAVFGTPIIEYRPRRLAAGRIALAGDAAHAASPMVGGGFRQGLQDVLALTRTLTGVRSAAAVPAALARYQDPSGCAPLSRMSLTASRKPPPTSHTPQRRHPKQSCRRPTSSWPTAGRPDPGGLHPGIRKSTTSASTGPTTCSSARTSRSSAPSSRRLLPHAVRESMVAISDELRLK